MEIIDKRVIFRDSFIYAAHPHAIATRDSWLSVFNIAPRRSATMHPPEDPFYRNVVMRSSDEGASWTAPEVVPDFAMSGTECAGLTVLSDGVILLPQWQFNWQPLGQAQTLADQTGISWPKDFLAHWLASPEHDAAAFRGLPPEQIAPWARCGGQLFISRSDDGGASFRRSAPVPVAPFSGAYGMRSGVELSDGRVMIPFSDVPNYRSVFTLTSADAGATWGAPRLVARAEAHEFEEASVVRLPTDRLLMCLRDNVTRQLHLVHSDDEGDSWTAPRAIAARGYPGHLLVLADGQVLLTMGWRLGPKFGIRALLSPDGERWNGLRELVLLDDLPTKNLGYPVTLCRRDGGLSTIYYGEDAAGVTCIFQIDWRIAG